MPIHMTVYVELCNMYKHGLTYIIIFNSLWSSDAIGDIILGLQLLRQWFAAWWHQDIAWTNTDFTLMRSTPEGNFTRDTPVINQQNQLDNYLPMI